MIICWLLLLLLSQQALPNHHHQTDLTVTIHSDRLRNRFIPAHALGAGVDGHDQGDVDRQLTPANIQTMLSAGLKSLTYRLRTELAGDAWHWNSEGTWSDEQKEQGYWIGAPSSAEPIIKSYGFKLPRRGNTIDQADNTGYSRIDDGDVNSFWKSNPYLDQHFTAEPDSLHPQWIVIDFGSAKKIDTIKMLWGVPFARAYQVQYANFDDPSDMSFNPPGMWRTFPAGHIRNGTGGDVQLKLSSSPVTARFVRIEMTESSKVAPVASKDLRDGLGYSMREIWLGRMVDDKFVDEVHHSDSHDKQTVIYVSSTDPWHGNADFDESVEQPGFDLVFRSGLTNGLPVMFATDLLYGVPENAAAEIQYLKSKGYPIERVELGEEPDGQFVAPEDYGALYLQFATAIHKVDASLKLGGPSFQEILPDDRTQRLGNSAFLNRFLAYIKSRARTDDYSFFSFEWYPFDNVCDPVAPQLAKAAGMLRASLQEMTNRGLSPNIPWIISEYGYSAFASRAEIGIEGALLNAEILGEFLALGGDQAFLYGYTPGQIAKDVDCTAGNNMLFEMDRQGNITARFATYFAARLLTQEWLSDRGGVHSMYSTSVRAGGNSRIVPVSAYAVYRPDGVWSVMLINKDPTQGYEVRVDFGPTSQAKYFKWRGPLDAYQYSERDYQLSNDKIKPFPIKSDPPEHATIVGPKLNLPAYSITVLRGEGPVHK